jgi:hypothetical protein
LNIFSSEASINTYIAEINLTTQTSANVVLENSTVASLFKIGNGGLSWNNNFSDSSSSSRLNRLYSIKFRFKLNLPVCCMLLNKNITNILEYEIKFLDQSERYILGVGRNGSFMSDENMFVNTSTFNRNARLTVRGVEMFIRKTALNNAPANIEISMFRCRVSNISAQSSPVPYNFMDLNNLMCLQDKDCQLMYDPKMACHYERCMCPTGFRQHVGANNQVQCIKALTGSILRMPQGCEIPHCDLQFFLFMHNNSNQNTLSMHVTTDLHFYLHEYFEVIVKNEKLIKFFIDSSDMYVTQDIHLNIIQWWTFNVFLTI